MSDAQTYPASFELDQQVVGGWRSFLLSAKAGHTDMEQYYFA
jgi:hypothetical protein